MVHKTLRARLLARASAVALVGIAAGLTVGGSAQAADTQVYFGDTHVHTALSGDAFIFGNHSVTPDAAYRYAKGIPVVHPYHKAKVQLQTPLDFMAVSDHAEYMGVTPLTVKGDPRVMATERGRKNHQLFKEGKGAVVFMEMVRSINDNKPIPELNTEEIRKPVWQKITRSADAHNEPGKFTTFIGWEWSSLPNGANLHRVVLLKDGAEKAETFLPYSSIESARPEDLWAWMDKTSKESDVEILAIPHNSNISKGLMFAVKDSEGKPITTSYAKTRAEWEPLVEVTQTKGDSETHPSLSPDDEFADFESYGVLIDARNAVAKAPDAPGNYVRAALKNGLAIEQKVGVNPFKLGMIGSTDSHTGLSSPEEGNFWGKMAIDSIPANKKKGFSKRNSGFDMSASGLAAVWATENTRDALFAAMKRKETYATTGPHMKVRFFGGWDYKADDASASDYADLGYSKGVPMGGDLTAAPADSAPTFLIHAVKDPASANLDRVQVIKGWVDSEGETHEKVFNVAMSDDRTVGADGQVSAVGNTVDAATALYTNDIGAVDLATVWGDPEFDASQRAFYYVRVLEIPTPRNSTHDMAALK
ncbi:MAG: DUF3604 domain-containing protein, partial [Parvibaculaceae bacterium]|nr:DUF3604 domain-containing protein [Parvibaculaceae bacterium]